MRTVLALFARKDLMVFSALFLVAGLGIGVWGLPGDWSLGMRLIAGLALALGAVISLFAPRMIGGSDYD